MDPLMFVLVLAAAAMHAVWNALIKAGEDKLVMRTLVLVAPGLVSAPALAFVPEIDPAALPYLLASVLLHLAYSATLVGAYTHGDLAQVYPIARGSAPALVALGGWLLAGEAQGGPALLGVLLISAGILALAWQRGQSRPNNWKAVGYAMATGAVIAGYSLADGLGARVSGEALVYALWLFALEAPLLLAVACWQRRGRLRASFAPHLLRGLGGGLVGGLGYAITIWAMSLAPLAQVVALRQTSVLFAAAIGTLVLGEPFGRRRLLAAGVIAAGAALLQALGR